MKSQLCFSLLMCFAVSTAHSKENTNTKKLATQITTAEPAHLTTRVEWVKFPQFQYDDADLNGHERHAIVRVKADETGKIIQASVQESTGVKKLDQILLKAVYAAKTKPFHKDGSAHSVIGYQAFSLKPNADENDKVQCHIDGISKNWTRQLKDKSVGFAYVNQPEVQVDQDLLKNQDRAVKFKFKVDKQGNIKEVKLKKLSGVNALDQEVVEAVSHAKVHTQRSARTLWIYKKSTLTDQIEFNLNNCK